MKGEEIELEGSRKGRGRKKVSRKKSGREDRGRKGGGINKE